MINALKKLDIPFETKRTNRKKTASIKVNEGKVQIIVPMELTQDEIEETLYNKRQWIREKIRLHQDSMPAKPKEYVNGECFTYLGKNYKLKIIPDGLGEVKLRAGYLELHMVEGLPLKKRNAFMQNQIATWYKRNAQKRLKDKASRLASIHGLNPKSFSVKDFKSRWGSCSKDGDITLNWRIIMAPHHIVDYVVAHEICHLTEYNHSPVFWKQVERMIPDYKNCKEWLKHNSGKLIV